MPISAVRPASCIELVVLNAAAGRCFVCMVLHAISPQSRTRNWVAAGVKYLPAACACAHLLVARVLAMLCTVDRGGWACAACNVSDQTRLLPAARVHAGVGASGTFAYTDSRVACGLSQSTVIRQVISRIDSLYGLSDCVRGSRLLRWQDLAARSSPTRHPPLPLSGATAAATATQCPLLPRLALRRWRHRAPNVPAPLEAHRPSLRLPGSGAQFDRGVPARQREPQVSRVLPR